MMYRWTRSEPFRDHGNDRLVEEGDVVELPEAVADPQPGFEPVEESESEPEPEEVDAEEPDYEEMDYSELRQLATEADTDEINGRSSKEEIVNYLQNN